MIASVPHMLGVLFGLAVLVAVTISLVRDPRPDSDPPSPSPDDADTVGSSQG